MPKFLTITVLAAFALLSQPAQAGLLHLNSGSDNQGHSYGHGNLVFMGLGGFWYPSGLGGYLNQANLNLGNAGFDNGTPFRVFAITWSPQPVQSDTMHGGGGGGAGRGWLSNLRFGLANLHLQPSPIEAPVPEPATLSLLALGAGLAGLAARRKMKKQKLVA